MSTAPHPSFARVPTLPALPPADDAILGLSLEVREALGGFWQMRSELELTAVGIFADVARTLFDASADQELLWLAARALTDELRHSMICQRVAQVYWQRPPPRAVPITVHAPQFGDAPPEVSRLLHATLNCCVNETIASAHLRATLKAAVSPLVREATRLLLADEIDHARIGWAHLASAQITPDLRAHVGHALPALLRLAERVWLRDRPVFGVSVPSGHGYLQNGEAIEVTLDAIRTLIFPGLEHVGIDTRAGDRWWQTRARALGLS